MKPSELEFITIGRILAPWGTNGELKVEVATDFPQQRFTPSAVVYIKGQPMTIVSARWHHGNAIVKLDAVNSKEAEELRGALLEVHYSRLEPLPEGQYFQFQLIGLEVFTTDGEFLGSVSEVLSGTGNDIYVVSNAREEILIPAIVDVVKSIDLERGCLIIEPIDGLLDLNRKPARRAR